jgi:hypothetical protein
VFNKETIWNILSTHMIAGVKLSQDGRPQCSPEELVEHIVTEFSLMRDIEREIRLLAKERLILVEEHAKHLEEIADSVKETREKCPHHSTTFLQSRQGGSTACDTCGKRL